MSVGRKRKFSCVWLFMTLGLQHASLSCPSLSPGACSNSCPLSQWCHPAILSSVVPQIQGLFQWVSSLHQVAKVLELQLHQQSFQWIFRTMNILYDWLVGSPCSPWDSQESSPTPQLKSMNSSGLSSILYGSTIISIHDNWKNHNFDFMDICQ